MFIMIVLSLLIGILLFHNITDCTRAKPLIHVKQVSIIITARNVERNIERLLQSIKQQTYPCVELIVCDDHSTDQTASIASSFGAKVIRLPTLPTGWLGKAWGCYNGAKEASGDVLIFVDADTFLQPRGLHRMLSIFQHSRKTMLTVHPYHVMKHPYEFFSSFFHLMVFASADGFYWVPRKNRNVGGFGQCILVRKQDYFTYEGHAANPPALLENMQLSQHIQKLGGSVACISGKGAINMRLYGHGIHSFVAGWSKSFATSAIQTNPWIVLFIVLWINGMITLCVHLYEGTIAIITLYILVAAVQYWILHRIGNFGIVTALLFPIHLFVCISIFIISFFQTYIKKEVL